MSTWQQHKQHQEKDATCDYCQRQHEPGTYRIWHTKDFTGLNRKTRRIMERQGLVKST